jgi:hypothetical protein
MKLEYKKEKYTYESQEEKNEHMDEMISNGWTIDITNWGLLYTTFVRKEGNVHG